VSADLGRNSRPLILPGIGHGCGYVAFADFTKRLKLYCASNFGEYAGGTFFRG
jgi:hypothetical protein